jgi:hypothetical protein
MLWGVDNTRRAQVTVWRGGAGGYQQGVRSSKQARV